MRRRGSRCAADPCSESVGPARGLAGAAPLAAARAGVDLAGADLVVAGRVVPDSAAPDLPVLAFGVPGRAAAGASVAGVVMPGSAVVCVLGAAISPSRGCHDLGGRSVCRAEVSCWGTPH